ncbi:HNH/ENDO VII family nuclease [Bartonella sp. B17]
MGEAAAMLQYGSWIKGLLQEEVGDLDGRTLTAEEQAGLNAKIDAQFADFKVQTIDVARVAGGFAAALAGGDVNTGADAAGNAAENNYLSSAQQAQMQRELAECLDDQCRRDINEKWHEIDNEQDIYLFLGVVAGVPAELYDTINDLVHMGLHPIETLTAVKDLITSGDGIDRIKQSYAERIDRLVEEFEKAGAAGAFNAGVEAGKLLTEIVSLGASGVGVAKEGVKLVGKAGTKLADKLTKKPLIEAAVEAETAGVKTGSEVAQSLEKNSSKAAVTQNTFWKPIEYTDKKMGQISKVYQRNDLFDPYAIVEWTEKGEIVKGTNIERMATGRAPWDFSGRPIELHHMLQTPDGSIAEVTKEFHNKNSSLTNFFILLWITALVFLKMHHF